MKRKAKVISPEIITFISVIASVEFTHTYFKVDYSHIAVTIGAAILAKMIVNYTVIKDLT